MKTPSSHSKTLIKFLKFYENFFYNFNFLIIKFVKIRKMKIRKYERYKICFCNKKI